MCGFKYKKYFKGPFLTFFLIFTLYFCTFDESDTLLSVKTKYKTDLTIPATCVTLYTALLSILCYRTFYLFMVFCVFYGWRGSRIFRNVYLYMMYLHNRICTFPKRSEGGGGWLIELWWKLYCAFRTLKCAESETFVWIIMQRYICFWTVMKSTSFIHVLLLSEQ